MSNELKIPFSSEPDFNIASQFVWSKVVKMRIEDYFGKEFGGMEQGSERRSGGRRIAQ